MNYREKFSYLFKEMKSVKYFKDIDFFLHPPVNLEMILYVEKKIKKKLPESMKEFYSQTNGLYFRWFYKSKKNSFPTLRGKSAIGDIENIFSNRIEVFNGKEWSEEVFWNGKNVTKTEMDLYKKLTILDNLDFGTYVVFSFDEGDNDLKLFLYSTPNNLIQLSITFSQYIECLIQARGMYLWQLYVADLN